MIAVMLAGAEVLEEKATEGVGCFVVGIEAIVVAIVAVGGGEGYEGN